jgi:putative nucleotidyltransferase with HDIG domain
MAAGGVLLLAGNGATAITLTAMGEKSMPDVMEEARKLTSQVGDLPPMPAVIFRSLQMLNDPSITVRAIQDQIILDQGLTAFILKVANSALYGMRSEVSTISQAINLMGYNSTRSILLSFLSRKFFHGVGSKMVQTLLSKHALAAGVFGKKIAEAVNRINSEEAFIAALLHDIGKGILFHNKPGEFEHAVSALMNQEKSASVEAEYEFIGYSHLEVGYLLMKKWGFSQEIIESLIYHHSCQEYSGHNLYVPITSLANKLCHQQGYALGSAVAEIFEAERLGINQEQLDNLTARARNEIEIYLELID